MSTNLLFFVFFFTTLMDYNNITVNFIKKGSLKMKKMIFASVVACALSLTSCLFNLNMPNSQDSLSSPDPISMENEPEAVALSGEEYTAEKKTVTKMTSVPTKSSMQAGLTIVFKQSRRQ